MIDIYASKDDERNQRSGFQPHEQSAGKRTLQAEVGEEGAAPVRAEVWVVWALRLHERLHHHDCWIEAGEAAE